MFLTINYHIKQYDHPLVHEKPLNQRFYTAILFQSILQSSQCLSIKNRISTSIEQRHRV